MTRTLRGLSLLAVVALALTSPTPAKAQYYPPGYLPWGWGGWGVTPAGATAAGLGVYAAGAGQYNLDTAAATRINVATAEQYNDYMWETRQARNHEYYMRLVADANEDKQNYDAIQDRILNNPNQNDINKGDALNAVFDLLTAPKVYSKTLAVADMPMPGQAVASIPFNYAAGGVTISLQELASRSNVPAVFNDPAFRQVRDEVRAAADQLKKETADDKPPTSETIKKFRAGLDKARATLEKLAPEGSNNRTEGENYLKALYGVARMLETPAYDVYLAAAGDRPTVPVRDVIAFMHAFNLRFGQAKTPEQREVYSQLYGVLSDLRSKIEIPTEEILARAKQPPKGDDRVTNFFSKMDYRDMIPPAGGTPPPPPAGAPSAPRRP